MAFAGLLLSLVAGFGCRGRTASEAEMQRLAEATRASAEAAPTESEPEAVAEASAEPEAAAATEGSDERAALESEGSDAREAMRAARLRSMEGSGLPGQQLRPRLQQRFGISGANGPGRINPEMRQRLLQRRTEMRGNGGARPGQGLRQNLQFRGSRESNDPTTGQGARYQIRAQQAREL